MFTLQGKPKGHTIDKNLIAQYLGQWSIKIDFDTQEIQYPNQKLCKQANINLPISRQSI